MAEPRFGASFGAGDGYRLGSKRCGGRADGRDGTAELPIPIPTPMDPTPSASHRRRLLLLSPASPASPAVVKALFQDELSPVSDLRLTMEQLGRG